MKESKTKYKTIRYKKVDLKGEKTLYDYIKEVVIDNSSNYYKVKNRQQSVSNESDDFIFINHVSEYKNMIYGELVIVEIDKSQQYIDLDDEASEYKISSLSTSQIASINNENAEELKREFVDSVLYFGIIKNHMAIIQSRTLTARTLESYLDWLLGEASEVMADDYAIILKDTPNLEIEQKLNSTPAKTLVMSTDIDSELNQDSTEKASASYTLSDKVVQVFKAMLNDDLSTMRLEDDLEDANLRMKIEMTYDRKTSASGQRVIDSVAASLRHSDDYKIYLTDGSSITADQMKLSGTISMQIIKGNVYQAGLKSQIHTWLIDNVDFSE